MEPATISEAVEGDIKAKFLADAPIDIDENRVRISNQTGELPCPRIEIMAGDPVRFPKQDGTGNVPVTLRYITGLDSSTEVAGHDAAAGALDAWWRGLRQHRKPTVLPGVFGRFYVHDVLYRNAMREQYADEREQASVMRSDWIVTLYDPDSLDD